MKCPNCDGSGIVNEPIYNKSHTLIKNWAIKKCDICNGSGEVSEVKMTNEEYIQTCNTEQLAEAIYYLTWFHTELDERLDKNVKNGCYNDDENIKIVTEWLKQPHSEVAE